MAQEWYSLRSLAKAARIPESTARRYAKLFSEFVPSQNMGRGRVYYVGAVDVLREIKAGFDQGKDTETIREDLAGTYQKTIELEPAGSNDADTQPEAVGSREIVAELVAQMRQGGATEERLGEVLQRLEKLEHRVHDLEQGRASIWKRLIGKK